MSNDVVLSAALRNNLLSLQQTQKGIDTHQGRLSTGKKVNSALDNPQSFFAAQSLSNRASDLSNLLDNIGQSIQVITAANNGVTALTSLVNQAQSIASQAQSTLDSASATAKVTGAVSLNGATKLSTLTGFVAGAGESITISITNPDGTTTNEPLTGLTAANGAVAVAAGDTVNDLVTKINDLNASAHQGPSAGTTANLSTPVIKASLDSSGHIQLEALNGGTLHVQFAAGTPANAANLDVATSLGFGSIAKTNQNGAAAANSTVDFTASSKTNLGSSALYTSTGTLAQASSKLTGLVDATGTPLITSVAADTFSLTVGGKTSADLLHVGGATGATQTIQGFVDAINHDSNIDTLVKASFDGTTGKISLQAIDSTATDVKFSFSSAAATPFNIGFGTNALTTAAAGKAEEVVRFGAAASSLANLETQYNSVRSQIDALVTDTGYAGTNLLNGDTLTTYFDEGHTSSLKTQGTTFTSGGLGLKAANFASDASVSGNIDQVNAALTAVRSFGTSIAGDLSIIQTRQTFTNNLINTLKTGSDNLTNADQNEESADLLALQTRQSLGVTALSLASQSQQAVLKLF